MNGLRWTAHVRNILLTRCCKTSPLIFDTLKPTLCPVWILTLFQLSISVPQGLLKTFFVFPHREAVNFGDISAWTVTFKETKVELFVFMTNVNVPQAAFWPQKDATLSLIQNVMKTWVFCRGVVNLKMVKGGLSAMWLLRDLTRRLILCNMKNSQNKFKTVFISFKEWMQCLTIVRKLTITVVCKTIMCPT